MRWQQIAFCLLLLAIVLAVSFIPWPIHVDPRIKELVAALLAAFPLAIIQYSRTREEEQVRRDFANYRCPYCRYFVDRDADRCPKCDKPITPRAE